MKITNEFTVPIPVDQAWKVLTDLEGIAGCLPGAQLTGVDAEVYQGRVKVKVGPVISDFSGTARFAEKDATAYRAVIDAKGRDARSAGNAAAVVSAVLTADGENGTRVSVDTDLKISGKLAQFGSGMIKEVSSKLLAQFVTNLEAKLAADPGSAAAGAAPVVPDPSAGEVEPAAGRIEVAEGTPVPVAPLRTPNADLPAAAAGIAAAPDSADAAAGPRAAATPESGEMSGDAVASTPAGPVAVASEDAVPAAATSTGRPVPSEEPDPLDLLDIAGGSISKRVIPVAVVAVAAAVIVWFVARG